MVIVILLKMTVGVVVVRQRVFLQMVRPGETFPAVVTPVFPLPRVYPEVPVKFIRPGKLPGAAWPGTEVRLITNVPPEVSS